MEMKMDSSLGRAVDGDRKMKGLAGIVKSRDIRRRRREQMDKFGFRGRRERIRKMKKLGSGNEGRKKICGDGGQERL